jgi:hypothetical protein
MSSASATASAPAAATTAAAPTKTNDLKDTKVDVKKDMRTVVLSFPSMDSMADGICKLYPTLFRRGSVKWSYFPDGWPNISFEHVKNLENRHVIFLG